MRIRKLPAAVIAALALVAAVAIGALAETVYVTANSTVMFENKERVKGEKRRTLYRGEEIKRLKEEGEWSLVEVKPAGPEELAQGYVRSADLGRDHPKDTMVRRGRKVARTADDPILTAGSRQLGPLGTKYAEENNLLKGKTIVEETMDFLNVPISDKIMPDDLEKARKAFYGRLEGFQESGSIGAFAGAGEVRK